MKGPFIGRSSIQVEPNLEFVALSEREENTIRLKVLRFFSHLVNYVHLSISIFTARSKSVSISNCVWPMGRLGIRFPGLTCAQIQLQRATTTIIQTVRPSCTLPKTGKEGGHRKTPLPEWVPGRQWLLQNLISSQSGILLVNSLVEFTPPSLGGVIVPLWGIYELCSISDWISLDVPRWVHTRFL